MCFLIAFRESFRSFLNFFASEQSPLHDEQEAQLLLFLWRYIIARMIKMTMIIKMIKLERLKSFISSYDL